MIFGLVLYAGTFLILNSQGIDLGWGLVIGIALVCGVIGAVVES